MKKLSIILGMALMAVVTMFSCKDESGTYVEQLYTNAEKDVAIRECLRTSADSAVKHLCVPDGFYNYNDAAYRIDFDLLQSSLFDTLENHGYGYLSDTLILRANRLAESCGGQILPTLKTAIDSLIITDYDALVYGSSDAITRYFTLLGYSFLKTSFQTPVNIRLNLYGVNEVWNEMIQRYTQYTPTPLNFDLPNYIVEEMLDDILVEMSVEEGLIRTDSTHRTENTELLGE